MFALVTAVLGLMVSGCTSSPSATPDPGSTGDQTASSAPTPPPPTSSPGSSAGTSSPASSSTTSSAARIVISKWSLTFVSLPGIPKEDLVVNSFSDDPNTVILGSTKLRSEADRTKCSGRDIALGGFVTLLRSTTSKAKDPTNEVKIADHYYGVYPGLADKSCYPESDYQTYFDGAVVKQVRQTLAER